MIRRDGNSEFFDNLEITKRKNVFVKTASATTNKKIITKEKALKILNAFKKNTKSSKNIVEMYIKRLDSQQPGKVLEDFFNKLKDMKKAQNELTIKEAKFYRQNGFFKKARADVYQDVETGDFWVISQDNKSVTRMFKENDGVAIINQ